MSPRVRYLTVILVASTSFELACSRAPSHTVEPLSLARCAIAFSDTVGWQRASSSIVGAELLMPPGYRRMEWESSNVPWRSQTEDWWPASGVQWTIELALDSVARPAVPRGATDVMHCALSGPAAGEAWRYRADKMVSSDGSSVVPFIVRGQWRRGDGRWIRFAADGRDSAGAERMLRVVASLRLLDGPR